LNPLHAALLGLLQGLTEFLPVSSSGHLVLGRSLLDVHTPGADFEVFAHAGTLLAILVHYRTDLVAMAGSAVRLRRDGPGRLLLLVLLASIPAAVVGLTLADPVEALFARPALAAGMLLVTGLVLLSTRLARAGGERVRAPSAIAIGLAQALAILPGISRSGSTIAAGLHAGVDRDRAARFSFLLAVPALLGAAVLKTSDLVREPPGPTLLESYLVGGLVAFASGYLALRWLLGIVHRGHLDRFAWYCLAIGAVALLLLL
jgi:undecaprenyl-diphosphatase